MRLNEMGLRTDYENEFTVMTVVDMLRNPIYIGTMPYARHITQARIVDGKRVIRVVKNPNPLLVDGLQEAIIDMEL